MEGVKRRIRREDRRPIKAVACFGGLLNSGLTVLRNSDSAGCLILIHRVVVTLNLVWKGALPSRRNGTSKGGSLSVDRTKGW
jgi:hypothetical protein